MKKTLLVVALATMFVFAVAGSAFATNHSGQARTGAEAPASATVVIPAGGENVQNGSGGFVHVGAGSQTVAGAGTNTYADWNPTLFGNAQTDPNQPNYAGNSPHGNFTTTTVKCVVCHAVHYAAPGGVPIGSGQDADTLLRNRADAACIYCHATADEAVNGTPVYDGLGGLLPGHTGGDSLTVSYGHQIGNDCHECHSSVHGTGADHSIASLDGFLLNLPYGANLSTPHAIMMKVPTSAHAATTLTLPATSMADIISNLEFGAASEGFTASPLPHSLGDYTSTNSAALREEVVGVFCAECHEGAYVTGAPGATTNVWNTAPGVAQTPGFYTGHRIGAGIETSPAWNADGSKSSGAFSGQVAWAAADNCKSCHDATDLFGNVAFPHAWGGTKMWLMSAAYTGGPETSITPIVPIQDNAPSTQSPQLQDGVCLKCHVSSDGSSGVGLTF